MTIYKVSEDIHGLLVVCSDYRSAIHYLVNNNWVMWNSGIWTGQNTIPLWEYAGIDEKQVANCTKEDLHNWLCNNTKDNDLLYDMGLYIQTDELYEQ